MHQRLAAGNADHGRVALFHRAEAFGGSKVFFQDVGRVLNFAAAGARQVAAEQRFQHQDQGIALAPGELLPQHVTRYRPHLRNWYRHSPSYKNRTATDCSIAPAALLVFQP